MWYICRTEYYSAFKRKKSVIFYLMDDLRDIILRIYKSGIGQILYYLPDVQNLNLELVEAESRMLVTRG
jgi:hypothetical protein